MRCSKNGPQAAPSAFRGISPRDPLSYPLPILSNRSARPRLPPQAGADRRHQAADGRIRRAEPTGGLGKILNDKPKEAEAWTFTAAGQAVIDCGDRQLAVDAAAAGAQHPRLVDGERGGTAGHRLRLARNMAAKDYAKSRAGAGRDRQCLQSLPPNVQGGEPGRSVRG